MIFKSKITLPLKSDQLQKVFKNKTNNDSDKKINLTKIAKVDYKKSSIKDEHFLNFVSNLSLNIDIIHDASLTYEEKASLLKAYMTSRNYCEINTLRDTCLVLMLSEHIDTKELKLKTWLNKKQLSRFKEENKDIVEKWIYFLDSVSITMPFYINSFADDLGQEILDNNEIELIDDPMYVGVNVGHLIASEGFMDFYISVSRSNKKLALFESHLNDPVFNGLTLIDILSQSKCATFIQMVCIEEQLCDPENLDIVSVEEAKKIMEEKEAREIQQSQSN